MSWIWDLIVDAVTWLVAQLEFIWDAILRGIRSVFQFLIDLLPDSFVNGDFLGIDWSGFYMIADGILWLFPIVECIGIIGAGYAVCGSIRLVRWVLAAVPTIGG